MINIEEFAIRNIETKISELPNSKVIDRNVVIDSFLDLRQELLELSAEAQATPTLV